MTSRRLLPLAGSQPVDRQALLPRISQHAFKGYHATTGDVPLVVGLPELERLLGEQRILDILDEVQLVTIDPLAK